MLRGKPIIKKYPPLARRGGLGLWLSYVALSGSKQMHWSSYTVGGLLEVVAVMPMGQNPN